MVTPFEKAVRDIRELDIVDSTTIIDNKYIEVKFNESPTWDVIRKPMVVGLNHFHIPHDFEETNELNTIRYKLKSK